MRSSATSRACQPGVWVSTSASLPSPTTMHSPCPWTGANTAERVPITTVRCAREIVVNARCRAAGPSAARMTIGGMSCARSAAASTATSRASGTTTIVDTAETDTRTAATTSSIHEIRAGTSTQAATGSPFVTRARNALPPCNVVQLPVMSPSLVTFAGSTSSAAVSVFACRPGTANRNTSAKVPAYRSATARTRLAIRGVSTTAGETTARISAVARSASSWSSRTTPVTSRPANPTRTRTPTPICGSRSTGTR